MNKLPLLLGIFLTSLLPLACQKTYSLSPLANSTPTYTGRLVSTLAGGGVCCSTNGPGTIASFSGLTSIAVDSSGNVYVADPNNDMIRKITPAGMVSTLFQGYILPIGVGVDTTGNVYVAASESDLISWITPGGVPTTLAGQAGVTGATNGTGAGALFNFPTGIAVDSAFNVYVADNPNQLIRKITPGGVVSTLAGQAGVTGATNATGTAASFNHPFGVAVDAFGNVYVADSGNDLIREITPGGVVSTVAGQAGVAGSTNGPVSVALLDNPYGVAVDSSGYLYVAEYNSGNLVRKISP